ncbi:hypothetical protein B296_00003242 [Ensete ventricosum]|uniref:Uncharacterized protein n=1 Tax=Ensete ventricosum TaxID=4639 RepID=A0A427AX03_ENSVE|nr:hypothetical protein B296_00003242 [Ensete ventricosum]
MGISPHQENEGAYEQGGPHKDASPMVNPKKESPPEAPHMEGSSRRRDKTISWPRSMRYLYRVRAHSHNKPFLAQEIADLPKMSREGPLETCWATLTPRSKVWADGADT